MPRSCVARLASALPGPCGEVVAPPRRRLSAGANRALCLSLGAGAGGVGVPLRAAPGRCGGPPWGMRSASAALTFASSRPSSFARFAAMSSAEPLGLLARPAGGSSASRPATSRPRRRASVASAVKSIPPPGGGWPLRWRLRAAAVAVGRRLRTAAARAPARRPRQAPRSAFFFMVVLLWLEDWEWETVVVARARRRGRARRGVGAEHGGLRAPLGLDGGGRERGRLDDAGERRACRSRGRAGGARGGRRRRASCAGRCRSSRRRRRETSNTCRTGPPNGSATSSRRGAAAEAQVAAAVDGEVAAAAAPRSGRRTGPWPARRSRTEPGRAPDEMQPSPARRTREAGASGAAAARRRGGAIASATSSGTGVAEVGDVAGGLDLARSACRRPGRRSPPRRRAIALSSRAIVALTGTVPRGSALSRESSLSGRSG